MLLFFLPIEVNQNLSNAVSCYKNLLDVKAKSIEETNDQDFQDFFNDEVISRLTQTKVDKIIKIFIEIELSHLLMLLKTEVKNECSKNAQWK